MRNVERSGAALLAAFAVAAPLVGILTVAKPTLALGVIAGAFLIYVGRRTVATAWIWFGVVALVPIWVGAPLLSINWPLASLLALPLLAGLLLFALPTPGQRLSWVPFDLFVVALVAATVLGWRSGGSQGLAADTVIKWGLPYLLFRVIGMRADPDKVRRVVVVVAVVVAAWSIAEFITGVHLFAHANLPATIDDQRALWQPLLARGGSVRSEAAFGHPIALAAFLGMALPFALRTRGLGGLLSAAVLVGGVLVTISRTGAIAVGVAVALTLLLRGQRYRKLTVAIAAVGAYLAYPLFSGAALDRQAQLDLEQSSHARDFVLSTSLDRMHFLGAADPIAGVKFTSVDNAYLRHALDSGALAGLLLVGVMVYALYVAVLHRPGPATVALAVAGACMATVALITQWELFVWAFAGLAASELQRHRGERGEATHEPATEPVAASAR